MNKFFWRITICVAPLLISAWIVGNAFYNYLHGKGGFKLGVDLAGGTILIYEVDVDKFPDQETAGGLEPPGTGPPAQSRIDPGDIYNITIRVASSTRFEIILPTGGKHQIDALEKAWRSLIAEVEKEYPIETYAVPAGRKLPLVADVYSQYAEDVPNDPTKREDVEAKNKELLANIQKLINDNYKYPLTENPTPEETKAWDELIKKVVEKYKPRQYEVGRGKTTELINLVLKQHPRADLKEVAKLINPEQGSGAAHKRAKRGQSMTEEQVQEREGTHRPGGQPRASRSWPTAPTTKALSKPAQGYFRNLKDSPQKRAELERLAFLGKPPPSPVPPGGGGRRSLPEARSIYLQPGRAGVAVPARSRAGQSARPQNGHAFGAAGTRLRPGPRGRNGSRTFPRPSSSRSIPRIALAGSPRPRPGPMARFTCCATPMSSANRTAASGLGLQPDVQEPALAGEGSRKTDRVLSP